MNLEQISGIGAATALKLNEIGIFTLNDLSLAIPNDLIKQSWIDQAIELTADSQEPLPDEITEEPELEQEITQTVVNEPVQEDEVNPISINFEITSGAHKGKSILWKQGNPAMLVGRAGTYVGLSQINVSVIESIDGNTKFKFIWNNSISGAELTDSEYAVFSESVKKNAAPSYEAVASQSFVSRAVQGVQAVASSFLGGCTTCGN